MPARPPGRVTLPEVARAALVLRRGRGIGLVFYAYRELLARHFASLHDYEVDTVRAAGEGPVEIVLRPLGRAMSFVPGQFALVYIEAKDGWHRHPFTIASSPPRASYGSRS